MINQDPEAIVVAMPKGWVPDGFVPAVRRGNTRTVKTGGGLGDKIEKMLKFVGITEERYKELKKALHFKPTCGCPARKYFLNHLIPRLTKAFMLKGTSGALQALQDLIEETNEKFPKENPDG